MPFNNAVFGGGCFWGIQKLFKDTFGSRVNSVISGYAGGSVKFPKYSDVCNKKTGHIEVVKIEYDDSKIKYSELADLLIHDPTQEGGQGVDIGPQYISAMLWNRESELQNLRNSLEEAKSRFKKPLHTKIVQYDEFYPAEDYHQDYISKNSKNSHMCPVHYIRTWAEIESNN